MCLLCDCYVPLKVSKFTEVLGMSPVASKVCYGLMQIEELSFMYNYIHTVIPLLCFHDIPFFLACLIGSGNGVIGG